MMAAIVRCPFCDRRYNVAGLPAGTKVLCTSCEATLAVPALRRSAGGRAWIGAGLGAVALLVALAARPRVPDGAPAADHPPAAEAGVRRAPEETRRLFAQEFGTKRFRFAHWSDSRFLVAVEQSDAVDLGPLFEDVHDALASLVSRFERETGLPAPDEALSIVILTSRVSYEAALRERGAAPDACGFYDRATRRAVVLHEGAGPPIATLLHEATHQLIDHHARRARAARPPSRWFQEGMACAFESFRRTATAHVEVDPAPAEAGDAAELPLRDLADESAWEHPEGRRACYAAARALVARLRARPALFREVVRAELEGRGPAPEALAAAMKR